jgi:hypothetical protein
VNKAGGNKYGKYYAWDYYGRLDDVVGKMVFLSGITRGDCKPNKMADGSYYLKTPTVIISLKYAACQEIQCGFKPKRKEERVVEKSSKVGACWAHRSSVLIDGTKARTRAVHDHVPVG